MLSDLDNFKDQNSLRCLVLLIIFSEEETESFSGFSKANKFLELIEPLFKLGFIRIK